MECLNCSKEHEITEMHTWLKDIREDLRGENGMISQFNQFKGGMKLLYLIATMGGTASIIAIIRTFI